MGKAIITVRGGKAVSWGLPENTPILLGDGQALYEALRRFEEEGWRVDGELPPYTTEGEYSIKIVKDESRPRVVC